MNRASKRALERDMKRGINRHDRIVPLPALLDEFTVFDMPQSIIDQLANGCVDAVDDIPVFRDNTGQWCEIAPALEGWIFTWCKINVDLNLNLSLNNMVILANRLNIGELIGSNHIDNAKKELMACRLAFRSADRQRIVRIAKIAQLQILMEVA